MIVLNTKYSIEGWKEHIIFSQGENNIINGQYGQGLLTGTLEGAHLRAAFKYNNSNGLIEITFHENGFTAKWKNGLEIGPMRGKWIGTLIVPSKIDRQVDSTDANEIRIQQKEDIEISKTIKVIEPTTFPSKYKEYRASIEVKNTLKPIKPKKNYVDTVLANNERHSLKVKLINRCLPYDEGDIKIVNIFFLAKTNKKISKSSVQSLLDSKSNDLFHFDEHIIKDAKYHKNHSELVGLIRLTSLDCLKLKVIDFEEHEFTSWVR
jgi:hypothetical protein